MPMLTAACATIWAYWGSSRYCWVMSWVVPPGCPGRQQRLRLGDVLDALGDADVVEAKTGANELSSPMSA